MSREQPAYNVAWHTEQCERLCAVLRAHYGPHWARRLHQTYGVSPFRYTVARNGLGEPYPCDALTDRVSLVILAMQTVHQGWPKKPLTQDIQAALWAFHNTDGVDPSQWSCQFDDPVTLRYHDDVQPFAIIAPLAVGLCHAIAYTFYRYLIAQGVIDAT